MKFSIPLTAGVVIVLHAAFSLSSKDVNQALIVGEVALGFLCCLFGALSVAGDFQPARATEAQSRLSREVSDTRPEFFAFAHRGPALAKRVAAKSAQG